MKKLRIEILCFCVVLKNSKIISSESDILERLFVKLFNFQSKDKEIKLIPEMLNLLGCSKDNFIKLVKYMNYKTFEKENDIFIKYIPRKVKKINKYKNIKTDSPFEVLNKLSIK